MRFPGLRGLSVLRVLKLTVLKFSNDDMSTYAAALAYRVLFALFPFLMFLTALLAFLQTPDFFDWMRTQAAYFLPAQAMELVNRVLAELEQPKGGLLSLGIALALWSASIGVLATMHALNIAYDVEEWRPIWKRYPLAIVYTIGLAVLLVGAAALMVIGPRVLSWIAHFVGLDALFIALWTWVRWPLAAFLLLLAIALVYYAAPNIRQPFRLITPGAVLALTVWIAASLGFGYYVQNFAQYSETYGSIGAIIVLLFYFFLSASVLLFGAEVNAVIARESGEHIEEQA